MNSSSLIESIKNGSDGFPLTVACKKGHRFYSDFIEMMKYFSNNLTKTQYDDIIRKVKAGSSQDEQSYMQCMCELSVLYFVMRKYLTKDNFKYEPKYNGGYNPECSFNYGGKTVNIEVKCPHMGKRIEIETHDTLKVYFAERTPDKSDYYSIIDDVKRIITPSLQGSEYSGLEIVPRMDNKLKDYLEHSQKNFLLGMNFLTFWLSLLRYHKI